MRNTFKAFIFILLLLPGNIALGSESLYDILGGIRSKYSNLPGLTITYSREVITRTMAMLGTRMKGDPATGRMHFKAPYFLRLEQETPDSETIIANENKLWWYIPRKKQAHEYSSREFGKELRLLSDIFRGLTRVEDNFQVLLLDHGEQTGYQIELRPDPPWQEVDHIILTVASGYEIRGVDIYNQLGGITRFKLDSFTVKEKFEKDFFRFVIPEGVRLMKEGNQ